MKTAIIFYSLDGNCALVSEMIKQELGAEVYEIKTLDQKKRRGPGKIIWGCLKAMKKNIPIQEISPDLNAYDLIILGSPVWAGDPAPALYTFLNKTAPKTAGTRAAKSDGRAAISGKKIALFCSYGGSSGNFFPILRSLLPGNTIIGELGLKNPGRTDPSELKSKIAAWCGELKSS